MGKTTTYTVPDHVAAKLQALAIILMGNGPEIGHAFGQVASHQEVAAPTSPSLSSKYE